MATPNLKDFIVKPGKNVSLEDWKPDDDGGFGRPNICTCAARRPSRRAVWVA